jgi:hypothetical protein
MVLRPSTILLVAASLAAPPVLPQFQAESLPVATGGDSYVFLQRFHLEGVMGFAYHTEILACEKSGFSAEGQQYLDGQIQALHDFVEIPAAWWANNTASCVELGYGGALCEEECCSVGKAVMPLNKRQAVIANAALDTKAVFLYGTGFDGATAYHDVCDHKCWSNWAGTDYNILKNNCNTFTSTVLSCVYGLSQKKPQLGVSDMVTVSGHCPAETLLVV